MSEPVGSVDDSDLAVFLLEGRVPHSFDLFGKTVKMDLFPMGTRRLIEQQVSGLDPQARRVVSDILNVAHSLRQVGRFDFDGGKLDLKVKFVHGMAEPVFDLFTEEWNLARQKFKLDMLERSEAAKKSSPDHG